MIAKAAVTYRLDEKVISAFKNKCDECSVSQAEVISLMMQMYIKGEIIVAKKLVAEVKK